MENPTAIVVNRWCDASQKLFVIRRWLERASQVPPNADILSPFPVDSLNRRQLVERTTLGSGQHCRFQPPPLRALSQVNGPHLPLRQFTHAKAKAVSNSSCTGAPPGGSLRAHAPAPDIGRRTPPRSSTITPSSAARAPNTLTTKKHQNTLLTCKIFSGSPIKGGRISYALGTG